MRSAFHYSTRVGASPIAGQTAPAGRADASVATDLL